MKRFKDILITSLNKANTLDRQRINTLNKEFGDTEYKDSKEELDNGIILIEKAIAERDEVLEFLKGKEFAIRKVEPEIAPIIPKKS